MKLTSEAVDNLLIRCLFGKAPTDDETEIVMVVEGIVRTFVFNSERIIEHATEIGNLLAELPDQFHETKGGGWSFLQACVDKHGDMWAEHSTMESLFCLGIAAGKANWLLPRDMWRLCPGGMPYVVVTL